MKEAELAKHMHCDCCKKVVTHGGLPLFWVLTIERHGIKVDAVKRQMGLGMMLGSPALAQVMGPDEDMTVPMSEPRKFTLCEPCALEKPLLIGVLGLMEAGG